MVVCAIAVAWIGNVIVSNITLFMPTHDEIAVPFVSNNGHHHGHRHHRTCGEQGIGELVGARLLFGAVSIAVVIHSIILKRSRHIKKTTDVPCTSVVE